MSLSISVTGNTEVAARLSAMGGALAGAALGTAVQAGATLLMVAAQQNAPRKSGALARSIHLGDVQVSGMGASVTVGTDLIYARIQEYGGTIHAKGGGWLVFQTEDGQWHKVKSVTLPARPFMRPALDSTRAAVVAEIRTALMAQLGGAA